MNDYSRKDLAAAISLLLDEMRPTSMQYQVLQALVNRKPNGTPKMTYDLEIANREMAASPFGIEVPSIWKLIGLDIAPEPNFWDKVNYAEQREGQIRNAVYNLRDQFETLRQDPEDCASLYVFNRFGNDHKTINVVTLIHDYENASEKCESKGQHRVIGQVKRNVHRLKVQGKADCLIVNELASVFNDARKSAALPRGLADELKRLENQR